MNSHSVFFERCFQLANIGIGKTKSNPIVGAVIVCNNRIIGEGFHQNYGKAHAEVNAIASVESTHIPLLPESKLYVSLEPCCHHGKTPPCTNAILDAKIGEVHIGCLDPTSNVNGRGMKELQKNGVKVVLHNVGLAKSMILPFSVFQIEKRPFIYLKWAKSKQNFIGKSTERVLISNKITNIYSHKLRTNIDGILIGTNTAIVDNPSLTTRNYSGKSPIRLVIDVMGKIPLSHIIFSDGLPTVVFTKLKENKWPKNVTKILINKNEDSISRILEYCYDSNISTILVEGGRKLLQSFIVNRLWDEAVVVSTKHTLSEGVKAPNIHGNLQKHYSFANDMISIIRPISNNKIKE